MNLHEVIKRCQSGNQEAFMELFKNIEEKAWGTAYLISGNRGIAEDILQETYIRCFKEINNLRSSQNFNAWFYKILVHTGWKMSKKHTKRNSIEIPIEDTSFFQSSKYDLGDHLESQELNTVVQKAVEKLSNNLKTVIILYYYNNLTTNEISKTLGCLKATVKSRLFYARVVLKKDLSNYFHNEFNLNSVNGKES